MKDVLTCPSETKTETVGVDNTRDDIREEHDYKTVDTPVPCQVSFYVLLYIS